MVDTATDISNPEVLVREKLDELISFRNENQDIKEFWGKQYDLGLAWVQFPVCLLYTSPSPRDDT